MSTQQLEALAAANEMRVARAYLKQDLRRGRITLAQAMEKPCAQGMEAFYLLQRAPGVGKVKAEKRMRRLDIASWGTVTVGQLTPRQCSALLEALP